jgi:hypothetical protein
MIKARCQCPQFRVTSGPSPGTFPWYSSNPMIGAGVAQSSDPARPRPVRHVDRQQGSQGPGCSPVISRSSTSTRGRAKPGGTLLTPTGAKTILPLPLRSHRRGCPPARGPSLFPAAVPEPCRHRARPRGLSGASAAGGASRPSSGRGPARARGRCAARSGTPPPRAPGRPPQFHTKRQPASMHHAGSGGKGRCFQGLPFGPDLL